MKKTRRLLAFILTVALMIGAVVPTALAQESNGAEYDLMNYNVVEGNGDYLIGGYIDKSEYDGYLSIEATAIYENENAYIGIEAAWMEIIPSRQAAALSNSQVVALVVVDGNDNVIASTIPAHHLDNPRITNEYDITHHLALPHERLPALDITTGLWLPGNDERWRFGGGAVDFPGDVQIHMFRLRAYGIDVDSPVWMDSDDLASWTPLTPEVSAAWNVSVIITDVSRVWADTNISPVQGYMQLRLDAYPTIVATGSVASRDRIEVRVDGRRVAGGTRSVLDLWTEAEMGVRDDIFAGDTTIYMNNLANRRIRVHDFITQATIYTEWDGVITTNLHQRDYYIHVSNHRPTQTHANMMAAHGFSDFRTLTHIGLPVTATITWDFSTNYWVYSLDSNGNLVFLGRSNEQLRIGYALDKYHSASLSEYIFFSTTELDLGEPPVVRPRPPSHPIRGGGGGSGGGFGGGGNPPAAAIPPTVINEANAPNLVQQAVAAAAPNTTPAVRIVNVTAMPLATMRAAAGAAPAGREIRFNADSLNPNGSIDVRIMFNPALATKDINLSASMTSPTAVSVRNLFERHFGAPITVISLGQQGDFGMEVRIAARIDPALDVDNLFFYSYNRATNTFTRFTPSLVRMDSNGFLHFNTTLAGDIIISNTRF